MKYFFTGVLSISFLSLQAQSYYESKGFLMVTLASTNHTIYCNEKKLPFAVLKKLTALYNNDVVSVGYFFQAPGFAPIRVLYNLNAQTYDIKELSGKQFVGDTSFAGDKKSVFQTLEILFDT